MSDPGASWVRSPVVGVSIGAFAGGLTIFLAEALGHRLFGIADPSDPSSVTTAMATSVLLAWLLGCLVAGALATRWSRRRSPGVGLVAGLVLLAGAISNLVAIPHPLWMAVAALVLMPLATYLGTRNGAVREGA